MPDIWGNEAVRVPATFGIPSPHDVSQFDGGKLAFGASVRIFSAACASPVRACSVTK